MKGPVPTAKEALKLKWANLPGVHFAKAEEEKKKEKEIKLPTKPVEKVEKAKKIEKVKDYPMPDRYGGYGEKEADELSLAEAAELLGIPVQTMWRSIVCRGYLPHRRHRKSIKLRNPMYIFRKIDVEKLWKILCKEKGVPEGTKLENLNFMAHLTKKERMKFYIDANL